MSSKSKVQSFKWAPVRKSQPDGNTTVIVFHEDWDERIWLGYLDGDEWFWVDGMQCTPAPTHWMDFDEPPVKEEEAV